MKFTKEEVSCQDCIYLTTQFIDLITKEYNCSLLLPDRRYIGKKKLSRKKIKKIGRIFMKFIHNGIGHCHYFTAWKNEKQFTKESIGKRAMDFIEGRITSD